MDPTLGTKSMLIGTSSKGRPPPSEAGNPGKRMKQDEENNSGMETFGSAIEPPRTMQRLQAKSNETPIAAKIHSEQDTFPATSVAGRQSWETFLETMTDEMLETVAQPPVNVAVFAQAFTMQRQDLGALHKCLVEEKGKYTDLQSEYGKAMAEHFKVLASLKEALLKSVTIPDLEEGCANDDSNEDRLFREASDLKRLTDKMTMELQMSGQKVTGLEELLAAASARATDLQEYKEHLLKNVAMLEAEKKDLEAQKTTAEEGVRNLTATLRSTEKKMTEIKTNKDIAKNNLDERLKQMRGELDQVRVQQRKAEAEAAQYSQEAKVHCHKVLELQKQLDGQQQAAAVADDGEKARSQARILELTTSLASERKEKQEMAAEFKKLKEELALERTARKDALEKTVAKCLEVRVLKNQVQDLVGNIRVVCRARPLNPGEVGGFDGPHATIKIPEKSDGKKISLMRGQEARTYKYDRVFGPGAAQTEVFEEVDQLIQSSMDGYRVCIFSYGQTGSGKTHTMMGSMDGDGQGITPRALNLLFQTKEELEALGWTIELRASFLEIYNEEINDLLKDFPGAKVPRPGGPWAENNETAASTKHVPSSQRSTAASSSRATAPSGSSGKATKSGKEGQEASRDIHYDSKGNLWVDDLGEVEIQSVEQAMELVKHANLKRFTGPTAMNSQSSRSHAGLFLTIKAQRPDCNQEEASIGSLTLLDLAGSERLKESKANINKSLSTLKLVFSQIQNPVANGIPNYRDSMLTYLLKSSLEPQKRGRALMFVNVSPSASSYEQSKSSLEFASTVNAPPPKEAKKSTRAAPVA